MSPTGPTNTLAAEAPPAVEQAAVAVAKPKVELDGGEIIQLSIKPSMWLILLSSASVLGLVIFLGCLFAISMRIGATPTAALPFQVLAGLGIIRLAVATLQWATRLYVLTNRRVFRFKGVFRVEVAECLLAQISAVELRAQWYERALRLGTIHMKSGQCAAMSWEDVSHPEEIHELLVAAIHKAQPRG